MTGNELHDLRTASGCSLVDVANKIGLRSYQAVCSAEMKKDKEIIISQKNRPILANLFNVDIARFGGTPEKPQ